MAGAPPRTRSQWPPSPQTLSPRASHSVIAISPGLSCGGGGESVPGGRIRFFGAAFSVPSFASRHFGSGFAFVCFRFCFVSVFFFVCLCCARAWVRRPFACGCGAYACLGCCVLVRGLGCVAGVRQGLEVTWFVVVAGVDVVDVCCAHVACRVVPPVVSPFRLPAGGWWCGGRVQAGAFVFRFCENLFPGFVPVRWQALASVGCGPWHVCRVSGGVWVVGWWEGGGGLGVGVGFLVGVGFCVGVSGMWRCVAGGSWVSGWCAVRCGGAPLRPLLNSLPHPLGGLWVLVRAVPLLGGGGCRLVAFCGLWFFSDGVGWACGWLVLRAVFWSCCSQPWVVVAVLAGRSGSAACSLGVLCGCGLCGFRSCRGVVPLLVVLFPLGGPTWTVGLFVAPPFPPTVHDGGSKPPESGGGTHTLKR